jgi:hypothetical protein|tara:strand:- start:1136 stop:1465 length:330 start_codon:yes stop_codon:yes gene_type:complete
MKYGLSLNKDDSILFHLRADYYLSRLTKMGGRFVMVNYDISEGGKTERERISIESGRLSINGLSFESTEFFEDENIWMDTHGWKECMREFPRERKGYRISVFRKNLENL